MTRLLPLLLLLAACVNLPEQRQERQPTESTQPNIIVIFTDDMGYADMSSYGHPSIETPHLDRMAREGIRFTSWYSASSVCTPSRAALMTGRLPVRSGMASNKVRVLFPRSALGLPADELTIAEGLKSAGYATAMVGKWHLGHHDGFWPTDHGFDEYYGIPYSNDMLRRYDEDGKQLNNYPPLPMLEGTTIVDEDPDQTQFVPAFTERAISFIERNRENPFFLYYAHPFPHIPLFASEKYLNTSKRGLYGEVIEEIDGSVGRILDALKSYGLDDNTLLVFTSDNGPWLTFDQEGGSAGLFRNGKGTTWEGGHRVPGVMRWPAAIKPDQTRPNLRRDCRNDGRAPHRLRNGGRHRSRQS